MTDSMKPFVLIVDDMPENLFALEKVLRKIDITIIKASSGNEALSLTLTHDFALIILDVQMPQMDGFEVAEILKCDDRTADIPIIFVTAIDRSDTKELTGYAKGAVDFIFKPLNEHILRSKVQVFLDFYLMKTKLEEIVDVRTQKLTESNQKLRVEIQKNYQAQQTIIKSEKQFRSLVSNIQGAVYRSTLETGRGFEYISDKIFDISGYPAADFIQDAVRAFDSIVYSHDLPVMKEAMLKHIHEKTPYEIKYRIITAAGDIRWILEKGQVVKGEEGNASYLDGLILDVSDEMEKDKQLRQTQKMETIGTLAGGLAHDFNNVLSGIVGTLSLMRFRLEKEDVLDKVSLDQYVQTMEESSKRATDMVRQFLTISRKQDPSLAAVDLNNVIQYVMTICESSFDKSIQLLPTYQEKPALICADRNQIEQVLLNLCVNASHAMTLMRKSDDPHGGTLSVSLDIFEADDSFCDMYADAKKQPYWLLSVKDTGVGITDNILPQIFNPFFTTKKQGEGTGLGLSMVYSIVHQHRGVISVTSSNGCGAHFKLYFPRFKTKDGAHEVETGGCNVIAGKGTILVIDDESVVRSVAEEILQSCGYDVILAAGGKEGLELYEKNSKSIDAILLDVAMPEMSGKDVYIELIKRNPQVKVLLASGFKQDERVNDILCLGVNGYIQKPYTIDSLAQSIQKVLKV